jgi:hypothetical protein
MQIISKPALALIIVSLASTIIQPSYPLTIITVSLVGLYAWTELMLSRKLEHSDQVEKRLKDLEESVRNQSFSKVFK